MTLFYFLNYLLSYLKRVNTFWMTFTNYQDFFSGELVKFNEYISREGGIKSCLLCGHSSQDMSNIRKHVEAGHIARKVKKTKVLGYCNFYLIEISSAHYKCAIEIILKKISVKKY